ncbi:MAG: alpha/beta hydrolase [Clostridia bacterium]|nr:alpha/beta hydrolase [Clostridia bacterium]
MKTYTLWQDGGTVIEYYPAENRLTDSTVVIFPGGAYAFRAPHEGEGYALYLNSIGMDAFVCEYRVAPDYFPLPLLDARRAVRWVRSRSAQFGLDPHKIAVMGSSAGGHLAGMVSTYLTPIEGEDADEIDREDFLPDATILCYPVCHMPDETGVAHVGSFQNLCGGKIPYAAVSNDLNVTDKTPPAFIWHTSDDAGVNVINSYLYAAALRRHGIPHEVHVFPHGAHGLGLAQSEPHVAQWAGLMKNWFVSLDWLPGETNA